MSILLFATGALAFLAGVAMVGYGIPINEFSFGNTLIVAGTVAIVGGLVISGLGAAVLYLQRIADALAQKAPVRAGRPMSSAELPSGARPSAATARVPFPPKVKTEPKADAAVREPVAPEVVTEPPFAKPFAPPVPAPGTPFNEPAADYFAPSLPNPDEPPVTVEDEVSLSPREPMTPAAPVEFEEPDLPPPGPAFSTGEADAAPEEIRDQKPKFDAGWRSSPVTPPLARPAQAAKPAQNTYFDAMWPAEPKATDEPPVEPKWDSSKSAPATETTPEPAAEPLPNVMPRAEEPHAVAILKSGVVDGMGYTLYVDGSIEAELPQGTLRFASITELRQHLEKTS